MVGRGQHFVQRGIQQLRQALAAGLRCAGQGRPAGFHESRIGLGKAVGRAHPALDRKSTRLNSSHLVISYAVFCLKKKKTTIDTSSMGIYSSMCVATAVIPCTLLAAQAAALKIEMRALRRSSAVSVL